MVSISRFANLVLDRCPDMFLALGPWREGMCLKLSKNGAKCERAGLQHITLYISFLRRLKGSR